MIATEHPSFSTNENKNYYLKVSSFSQLWGKARWILALFSLWEFRIYSTSPAFRLRVDRVLSMVNCIRKGSAGMKGMLLHSSFSVSQG